MLKLKVLSLVILAIITLDNCINQPDKQSIKYGYQSRLMASLVDMDCNTNNLVIYNENDAYVFRPNEYTIITSDKNDLGKKDFVFKIEIDSIVIALDFINPRISFCLDGNEYIGRGNSMYSSNLPASCHFYFKYDTQGKLLIKGEKYLICYSTKFLSIDDYSKEVLGIKK